MTDVDTLSLTRRRTAIIVHQSRLY